MEMIVIGATISITSQRESAAYTRDVIAYGDPKCGIA